ncbi:MAG: hypothetical protein IKM04_02565 [Clostridia bacterium]|nr:hypothetical protein [Clostridia bacterium]
MKRVWASGFALILVMLILLAGCGRGDGTEGSVDINGYRLICSDTGSDAVRESCKLLKKAIRDLCGVELEVGTDHDPARRTEKEIIIGHTNLPEENAVYDTLSQGEYAIKKSGSKIIIVGYSDTETVYAVERFLELTMGYSKDKYENTPVGGAVLTIPDEKQTAKAVTYASGRVISSIPEMTGEPMRPSEFTMNGCRRSGKKIRWTNTGTALANIDTGEGSFRIEFTVDIEGENTPTVQLFTYFDGAEHICASITGSFVRIARATYERGGVDFTGDTKHYTFRMDVHPDSGRMQYFVNGRFLGEMNVGESDDALTDHSDFCLAAVGDNIDVTVSDIRWANIEDIGKRRYDAPRVLTASDDIYPKSQTAPADVVYVIEGTTETNERLLTIATLQGNVNRTTPEIFMDYRSYNLDQRYVNIDNEEDYIELLRQKGRTVEYAELEELLVKFSDRYKGVIVGDAFATVYGENVVTSLCGIMDAVYLTDSQYEALKDEIKKDILFRIDDYWDSPVDAYMWVWNSYGDRFSDSIIFHTPSMIEQTGHNSRACRDYAVMSRAFVFYTHGVECVEDYDFYMNLFATRAANSGIVGFVGGCFPEFEMFQVAGQFAKFWTYGFSTPNMSFFNSLEYGALKQKLPTSGVQPENDTVYVAFNFSEGDNLSWNYHLWPYNFANEEGRAAYPKGYSLCGALYYVAPALIEYYYDIATVNDYFYYDGGSISNIGSPDSYALMYKDADREKVMDEMLSILNFVCEETDVTIVGALNNISEEMAIRIDEACPKITALFSSYGNNTYALGGSNHTYADSIKMEGDIVRARCYLTTFEPDLDKQLEQLCNQVKSEDGIVFAKVFVYTNPILDDISALKQYTDALESTGRRIVYVRPDEYAALYREYASR